MLISNEPIKVADLQKLSSYLMLNGTLVTEMVNNSFSESKKNFGHLMSEKRSNQNKNRDMSSEKYNLLDSTKDLSFSEVQKIIKVVKV